jgi:hypothetical protein
MFKILTNNKVYYFVHLAAQNSQNSPFFVSFKRFKTVNKKLPINNVSIPRRGKRFGAHSLLFRG